MEEVITNKKQENEINSNIELEHIYNAIRNLKPEHQINILSNYKIIELFEIFSTNEKYEQYLNDLFAIAGEYRNRAIALSLLHTEAFLQSMRKNEKLDGADLMCQMYDCIPETDRKRFCESIFQKKDFFEDAYRNMISVLENAVKSNEATEKNTAKE